MDPSPQQQNPTPYVPRHGRFPKELLIGIIVILAVAGIVGLYYYLQVNIKVTEPAEHWDWQTYRNEEFGFEFKYPENQIKTETVNINQDGRGELTLITVIDHIDNPESGYIAIFNGTIQKAFDGKRENSGFDLLEAQDDVFQNRNSKVVIWQDNLKSTQPHIWKEYYFEYDSSRTMVFGFLLDQPLYPQILSTFKFIRSLESSQPDLKDWKIYTNTKFDFSIKYPKYWTAPDYFGGVNTPGKETYEIEDSIAYEYVFTFNPSKIDDFPAIITVYELSATNPIAGILMGEIIGNIWEQCGKENMWSDCKRYEAREMITISENPALLVTVTAEDDKVSYRRTVVFLEKGSWLYGIEHSGSSSDVDFESFYHSFTFK